MDNAHYHKKYLTKFESQIMGKMSELELLTAKLLLPKTNIKECGIEVEKIHNVINNLESDKEKATKKFYSLRDFFSPKISTLQRQLEEFLATKTSYDKFAYTELSVVEVASYALCTLISICDIVKENQKK